MTSDPKQFYVTLFSNGSQELFPENTKSSFSITLTQAIDLGPNDTWEVGLCEFRYPPKFRGTVCPFMITGDTNAFIYCNLIRPQFVRKELIRCLQTIIVPSLNDEHYFQHFYYVPVEKIYKAC